MNIVKLLLFFLSIS